MVLGIGVRLSEQKGITYLLQAMPEIVAPRPARCWSWRAKARWKRI